MVQQSIIINAAQLFLHDNSKPERFFVISQQGINLSDLEKLANVNLTDISFLSTETKKKMNDYATASLTNFTKFESEVSIDIMPKLIGETFDTLTHYSVAIVACLQRVYGLSVHSRFDWPHKFSLFKVSLSHDCILAIDFRAVCLRNN